jgi:hypothetical protein
MQICAFWRGMWLLKMRSGRLFGLAYRDVLANIGLNIGIKSFHLQLDLHLDLNLGLDLILQPFLQFAMPVFRAFLWRGIMRC